MSEQNSKSLSVSFRIDDGVLGHNNREFIAKNVDPGRIQDNITYVSRDIREVYNELFGQALGEYNAKQRRNDRKIEDYYEHIESSDRVKPFYEVVVQFGDIQTCGLKSGKWEDAKILLHEYMHGFEQRNPNLKVFNAVMHLDEATPHLHIDFVPVARNNKQGLSVKVSMKGALKEQGFTATNRLQNEWSAWEERERKAMTEILHKHDLSRDVKDVHREHYTVDEYKEYAAQRLEIKRTNEHINAMKKRNPAELTLDEVELIVNQNDFMRSEIKKRDEKIASLSEKAGAKFVRLEIFDEDKLQYVAAELEKANVPFVEENTALNIPEYAQNTAALLLNNYHQQEKPLGVHERVRLDIDRLVYAAVSLENLYNLLKGRGYEIKYGEHIAVKPPFAQRFLRLKTLGYLYLPNKLEWRILNHSNYSKELDKKYQNIGEFGKLFYNTIVKMMYEVKAFRLEPLKRSDKQPYTFTNDKNINYIAEQLNSLGEFGFTSREQMYAKAEELKAANDTEALKRVSDLITAYENIVEGNYIDNLIRAQKEREQAKTIDKRT